jgi:hypothetical protein
VTECQYKSQAIRESGIAAVFIRWLSCMLVRLSDATVGFVGLNHFKSKKEEAILSYLHAAEHTQAGLGRRNLICSEATGLQNQFQPLEMHEVNPLRRRWRVARRPSDRRGRIRT